MANHGALSDRMVAAARDLQGQADPRTTNAEAVRLAVLNVDGCDAAGLSLTHRRKKEVTTEGATDPMVRLGDRLQYETGEGPCLDAIWEEELVYSGNLAADRRWPVWGPKVAEETGARSLMAFRLFTHEETLGALNLYSKSEDGFDPADREDGVAIAAHIALAVSAAKQVAGLSLAVENRTLIGQAQGILMERFGLNADTAFRLLARLASTSEVKVRVIAAEIVGGGTGGLPEAGRP